MVPSIRGVNHLEKLCASYFTDAAYIDLEEVKAALHGCGYRVSNFSEAVVRNAPVLPAEGVHHFLLDALHPLQRHFVVVPYV